MKSLQNLSYKTLFTILFFSLAGIIFFLRIGKPTNKVSAAWWDEMWKYRQAINISSHTTTESNVYIVATINIGITTKAQIDDGDFRFTDQNGNLLSYYISANIGTTAPSFHIQFSTFSAGAQTIYAYYGNPSATDGFSTSDFSTQASDYTIGSLNSEELSPAPIAYWKFDEGVGTTAYDSTTFQNNGIVSGATWQNEDQCISGKCLYFDGTGNMYVTVLDSPSLKTVNSQTISMWLKPTAFGARRNPINKSYGGEGTMTLETDGGINYYWGTCGNNCDPYQGYRSSPITLNQWNFVTISRDLINNKLTWYINGKQTNQTTPSYAQAASSNTNVIIGKGYAGNFLGYIDEVKIYNYARTADQIKQDYNSRGSLSGAGVNLGVRSNTTPSFKSSLTDYWKFDNSLNNSISNGSTAVAPIGGFPTYTNSGQENQGLDFTQLYSGNFTYISSNTFQDVTKNWSTNELVGYQFATDYAPNNQYCQGTITSNTSNTIIFSSSCNSWTGNKFYRIKKSIYISAPLPNHSTSQISVSFWFKSNGSHEARLVRMSNEAFNLTIGSDYISTGINTYGSHISYTTNPHDQKWHSLVLTYDGSIEKLYYDGRPVGTYSTAVVINSGGDLRLATRNDGCQEFFNGFIDEVKIYNRALTAEEVKQDYNQGSAIQFGATNQTIGGTTTSLEYCIPGDTSFCASPIAEWNFEENTGTIAKDTSGNNNNGTFGTGNSAPTWSLGKNNIGAGLSFDGNDQIIVSDSNSLDPGDNISLEAWFNLNSFSGTNTLFSKRISNDNYWIDIRSSGTEIIAGGYTSSGSACYISSSISLTTNKWYHVTFTYDKQSMIIYLNGQKLNSTNNTCTLNSDTSNLYIGSRTNSSFFKGKLDNIKIYNYARTPAQIAYDYNKGAPVGHWKLDECQGSVAYDSSGFNNHGNISIGQSGTQTTLGTCQTGTSAAWTNGSSGRINSSLNFDGTDDTIDLGNINIGTTTNNLSVSVWINPKEYKYAEIFRKSHSSGYSWSYKWRVVSQDLYFALQDTSGNYHTLSFNPKPNLNEWTHLMSTYDGTTGKAYKNGQLISSFTSSFNIRYDNNPIYIGGASGEYFNGQIDDARIYNYALTAEQVKQVYNGGAVNFK